MRAVRTWLPVGHLRRPASCSSPSSATRRGLEGGALLIGAGLSVWLLNWFYLVSVRGERERDVEDAARDFFDRPRPLARRGAARPRRRPGAADPHRRAPRATPARTGARASEGGPSSGRAVGSVAMASTPPSPSSPSAPARPAASASTRSSWARAATGRCCASSRSRVRGARTARSRVEVLDPLEGDLDPAPLAEVLADPDDRGRHARRAPGRRAAAPRVAHRRHATSSTRRSPPASPACAPSSATRRCCGELLGRPPAQDRELHALGRSGRCPRSRSATRARTSCTCSSSPTRCRSALEARGRLELGARGVRGALEDATDERDVDALFARLPRVNGLDPAQRAVARELVGLARGDRARAGPPGLVGPAGRARSSRSPSAGRSRPSASGRSAACTRARCAAAARRSSRPSRAGASSRRSPSRASASRRPSPPTRR